MIMSMAMVEKDPWKLKIRHDRSLKHVFVLKTRSKAVIRDLKARPLTKHFSELRSSTCFIMLGVDFSREDPPWANLLSGVFTSHGVHSTVVIRAVHLRHELSNER